REPLTAAELGGRRLRRDSERRHATIVFAEVTGLDRLGHVMAPERLTGLLERCFAALAPAVERHEGVIDKYIGATLMALFGVPNAIEHAPQQGLAAAAELRQRLRAFAGEEGLDETLHVRVGVNSGLVIAGDIGGRATRAFTVIGDAVNVAARLKDAAGSDDIYVGRETQRAARHTVALIPLPPVPLKGKVEAVPVWRLEAGGAEPGARAGDPAPLASVLVGRQREFDMVAQAVARLGTGLGGVIGIVGEAGIGKSRLLAELLALPALRQVQVLGGRALSVGQRLAFHPVSALLRRWAGVEESDAPAAAAVKLARAVRAAMPDEFEDVAPFLASLAGVPLRAVDAERLRQIDGEALEALIFKAARDLCERLAAHRPLLLLFEDLHWAFQSSVKLIEGLLRLTVGRPVLLVLTARPDFADTSGRVLQAAREQAALQLTEVAIGRLADHECDALIQNLLGADTLPYPTRALIIRKAEGNPFFIEEVVRSFLDAGVVERRDGRIHFTADLDTVDVPSTVQDVILSRVDRLDEHTRHVLQVASVVGRSFSHRILADVLGDDAGELGADLARLKDRQLIRERAARPTLPAPRPGLDAALEYRFTHALGQEAVYGSILQRTRRDLHRRVAASIERLFADRLADVYGMLAYHYSRAEELAKAEEFLFKAGEDAARAAASAEALTFFREASQLYVRIHGDGGDARKRALLEKHIARALLNTGALTESIEHFDESLHRLGERVRRRPLATYGRFATDLSAVLAGLYLGGRRRGAAPVSDVDREVFEVVFDRARALTTSDPRRLFFESIGAIRRLNRCDASQIEGACAFYAGSSALFAFTAFSYDVSARFLAIAEPLIRSGSVRDRFTYRTFWFVHHYLQGNWAPDYAIEPALVDEALRAGGLWDVNTYVGLYCDLLLRQGDFAGAAALVDRLAEIDDAYGYGFAGTNRDAMRTLLLLERRHLDAAQASAAAYQRARHEAPLKLLGLGSQAKAQVLLGDLSGAAATLGDAAQVLRRARDVPPWHLSAFAAAQLRYDLAACAAGD
ncbi:MAG: ATP-binding protein, partial [Candidatus Binatia bacterium]